MRATRTSFYFLITACILFLATSLAGCGGGGGGDVNNSGVTTADIQARMDDITRSFDRGSVSGVMEVYSSEYFDTVLGNDYDDVQDAVETLVSRDYSITYTVESVSNSGSSRYLVEGRYRSNNSSGTFEYIWRNEAGTLRIYEVPDGDYSRATRANKADKEQLPEETLGLHK